MVHFLCLCLSPSHVDLVIFLLFLLASERIYTNFFLGGIIIFLIIKVMCAYYPNTTLILVSVYLF